jgi:universal stress protein E
MTAPCMLVVLDPTRFAQPALERAEALARGGAAALVLYCCCADEHEREPAALAQVERWAERVAQTVRAGGVEARVRVEWSRDWRDAMFAAARAAGAGLLVKAAGPATSMRRALLASSDVHVLHHSPVPALLVKAHARPQAAHVLAAVQVAADDDAHASVRDAVIERAHGVAQSLGAALHVVTVDPQRTGWFDRRAFAERCRVPHDRVHVERGDPVDAIVALAAALPADVVVLGTVAREDAARARIGRTAERLVHAVTADVLAVPPAGRA